ncbi:MAG: hypothetical protein LBI74_09895 [Synergistaceae bacterium]|jgi:hypothetical protein|nr:hypothetical protein [Synergistaceae bacterium]
MLKKYVNAQFFLIVILIGALAFPVALIIAREMGYGKKTHYDSWTNLERTMTWLRVVVMLQSMEGIPPPIGEFSLDSLRSRSDFKPYNNGLSGHPVRTSTIIISCDVNTGKVFVGFSNISNISMLARKRAFKNRVSRNDYGQESYLYSDIYQTHYAGGDTVLRLALQRRF